MDCLVCGHRNRDRAKFCEECGTQLVQPASLVPGTVTPAPLAEKMRRERPSHGEHRTVTVLFADAVGSTPLAEQLGEEQMYECMRECLSRMASAVHHREGYVASFTGDGIMALFGAPIAHEDSARRAVAAALGMQGSLEEYASVMHKNYGVACRFRVGLNTGPVVVGTVTDDLQMDFTAIGDTVNLAARMEQSAEAGSVLISEPTHRIVRDFFDCKPLGDLVIKGKAQPVRAWRVLREKPIRTRFQAAAEHGLTRFVGRDRELTMLEGYLERARQGSGQVVLISGEAGIGKSRLLLELRRRVEGQDLAWLEGHCISFGANIPYLPVVDLVKNTAGIQEGDSDADVAHRVDNLVSGWEEPARGAAPYLKHILSVDPGDPAVATMDPQERRVEVLDALRTLLLQQSSARPHVVVVEDLHWADEMSQEALGLLAEEAASAPVLLVLTFRPGYAHSFTEDPHSSRLALGQLDEDESAALVEGVLQTASLPGELHQLIAGKAEGNPFYIEEVTRALVEAGVMARTNGSFTLQRPVEAIHIPDTIQEVILSRIDRLAGEAKLAIQLASVIGREFRARLLERISDLEAKLTQALAELTAVELIYEKARLPELAYLFKHALTQDVAYGTLLAERRRALHRLVGAAIEELYADRLAEHYETLAHHYWEGEDWNKALDYLTRAGDKATAAYANQDALGYYARALEVCETLGEVALPAAASLAEKRALINFGIGDLPTGIADFDRVVAVGRRLGDRSTEGKGLAFRGFLEVYNHDFEQAEATLQEAFEIVGEGFEEVRPVATMAMANLLGVGNRMPEMLPLLEYAQEVPAMPDAFTDGIWNWGSGIVMYWLGHFDEAVTILEGLSERAERNVTNRLYNWWIRGMALAGRGDYHAALLLLRKTLDMCERVGDWQVRGRVVNTIGWVYAELEDHEQALGWNRSGVDMAGSISRMPDAEIEMNARLNLGDNLVALSRLDEAEEQFTTVGEAVHHPTKAQRFLLWRYSLHFFYSYGEFLLERGEPERALALADECLHLAEETGSSKYVVAGQRLRGRALTTLGRLDDAEGHMRAALDRAVALGNPPQLWRTYSGMGQLRRAQGRPRQARQAFAGAVSTVETVAGKLSDEKLSETLRHSRRVEAMRRDRTL